MVWIALKIITFSYICLFRYQFGFNINLLQLCTINHGSQSLSIIFTCFHILQPVYSVYNKSAFLWDVR